MNDYSLLDFSNIMLHCLANSNHKDESVVGSNITSKYIPVYTFKTRNYFDEDNHKGIYFYHKPDTSVYYRELVSYDELLNQIIKPKGFTFGQYVFKSGIDKNLRVKIIVSQGFVLSEEGKVLMIATTNSYDKRPEKEDIDIFVANEFSSDTTYKNVYKKIDNEIIQQHKENGYSIHYMDSSKIEGLIYNAIPPIEMNKLSDLNDIQDELNSQIHEYYSIKDCQGVDQKTKSPLKYGYTWKNIDLIPITGEYEEAQKILYALMCSVKIFSIFNTNIPYIRSYSFDDFLHSLNDNLINIGNSTESENVVTLNNHTICKFIYNLTSGTLQVYINEHESIFKFVCRYYNNYEKLVEKFSHSVTESIKFDIEPVSNEVEVDSNDNLPF